MPVCLRDSGSLALRLALRHGCIRCCRQEVSIACELSASRGNVPIDLPLTDRSVALYPSVGRWSGATVRPMYVSKDAAMEHLDRPLHQRNAKM